MPKLAVVLLFGVLQLSAAAARRRRPPPGPREAKPTIGDALDLQAEPDYIGKDWQATCVLTPGSANRRILKRDGTMVGMRRRRGMVTWLKKKEYFPWEKPWDDPVQSPFKVRFLKEDPAGIALALAQEKKLDLRLGKYKGRAVIGMSLAKPRPFWKFWPKPAEEEE